MTKAKRSLRWIKKHTSDPYVKRAQHEGYRSRAAYKLLAVHEKDHLFCPGQTVLDLGAAPGAWSQLAKKFIGSHGKLFAVDRLPMDPLEDVHFVQGDLYEEKTLGKLNALIPHKVDIVLSDMASNLSGIKSIDQPRNRELIELALGLAQNMLKQHGHLVIKCFHGIGFDHFLKKLRTLFTQVSIRKPTASRSTSSEVYLIAKTYQKKEVIPGSPSS